MPQRRRGAFRHAAVLRSLTRLPIGGGVVSGRRSNRGCAYRCAYRFRNDGKRREVSARLSLPNTLGVCHESGVAHIERRRRRGQSVWRARYRGSDGREHSRSFDRRVDAEAFLTKIEHSKLRGEWRDPALGRTTFAEWTDRVERSRVNRRPSTRARDATLLRTRVLATFGNQQVPRSRPPTSRPGSPNSKPSAWHRRRSASATSCSPASSTRRPRRC